MRKELHFIRGSSDKSGKYLVLWHVGCLGEYSYQIDEHKNDWYTPIAKIDGTFEDAVNVFESMLALGVK